ncbi:SDR family NAD(P)-dependent oxidoreductase [Rhodococcus sp. C3V]|uniref:SDR family NAD(P)-dependent oxidoreductase n=1 Tax=Rhodococcus sp. C3V TaxID=3034165 RepID=UPI0023E0D2EF|nr:SDR family NAD(P)-dependent oxidoreductase [Rhodococcus sp. C3V]MDF3319975.1 SDR family NAD(P)-dependent oxidoreductase [Rhodococcus sp. C3V]
MKERGAVVTGAGSGMGRSIALSLAAAGMNVVIADIDDESAQRVRDEVRALGVESIAVPADVAKLEQVEALAETAYSEFGDIAVLVNNAGVTWRPYRAAWDASIEDFRWILSINYWGAYHGHHAFVRRMRETETPKHIVNVSSVVALQASPGHSAYAAAKGAIDSLSSGALAEFETAGLPIGVTVLYPGYVKTDIGTSERLRPAHQRSASRAVISWDTYGQQGGLSGAENKAVVTDHRDVTSWHQAIDPSLVGPLVVDGIVKNRRFVLTHPFENPLADKAVGLANAYVPAS